MVVFQTKSLWEGFQKNISRLQTLFWIPTIQFGKNFFLVAKHLPHPDTKMYPKDKFTQGTTLMMRTSKGLVRRESQSRRGETPGTETWGDRGLEWIVFEE